MMEEQSAQAILGERVLALLNEQRAKVHLRPLRAIREFIEIAQAHVKMMVESGYYGKGRTDALEEGLRRRGYEGRLELLLARGTDSPDEVVRAWLADEEGQGLVLGAEFIDAGVGCLEGRWALWLGAGRAEAEAAPAARGPLATITAELRGQVLSVINLKRDLLGLPLYSASASLDQAAQLHAMDMARRGYFGVAAQSGHDTTRRAQEAGYTGSTEAVLAKGDRTPDGLCEYFLGRPELREILLDRRYRDLGIGMMGAEDRDGTRWVLICGQPEVESTPALIRRLQLRVNQERQRAGAPALVLDRLLGEAAQAHSDCMAPRDKLRFEYEDGVGVRTQVKSAGYAGVWYPLVTQSATADEALGRWMAIPEAQVHLLARGYTQMGAGVSASKWTLILGAPPAR